MKFKVWDLEEKEWSKPGKFNTYSIDQGGDLRLFNWAHDLAETGNHLKIVHSTGQFDKKVNDIYEGDILKVCGNAYTMDWRDGDILVVEWSEDFCGWHPFCDDHSDYNGLRPDNVKIIGNKYENPELLETK